MTEHNPSMKFNMGGNEYELNRYNSSLFMFVGRSAIRGTVHDHSDFNHIFVELEKQDEIHSSGLYIPKMLFPEAFQTMANFMGENCFPAHVNLNEVADCDVDAIYNMLARRTEDELKDIPNEIPDDWV